MPTFVNFYENLKEAQMRLRNTVVMYDGHPYYVVAITNHRNDGVFRIYLDAVDWGERGVAPSHYLPGAFNFGGYNYEAHHAEMGKALDLWMTANPDRPLLRKKMDSKLFDKYRPFPLGMINYGNRAFYLERQPQRNREQGLTKSMITETSFDVSGTSEKPSLYNVNMYSAAFVACVKGNHPSAKEVIANFKDPAVQNAAVAFHRHFALMRGPCEMLFLAYKAEVIGVLPRGNLEELRLGPGFGHCREVVGDLHLFGNIITDPRAPVIRPRAMAA